MSNNLLRIGNGFDSHRLEEGYKLILGGIEIPFEKGLVGHSDADVLTHSIIDCLLGASNLGDIGEHFPPSDPAFKGISSLSLLKNVKDKLLLEKWQIVNIDCILICERPKISSYKNKIVSSLAEALNLSVDRLSIKGKTAEKMGSLGREEGIVAISTCLLEKG
ncbi:MAG: 2-C-methyl-D-erythritol 2,4-cyclodiphosphate synthase [Candidatus Caenarcaniphilales bacterium]|nr:2-C-methyl-D-erythritol 2,4-cyclodiphosphate synthase [Candidatus Caenarcaniphilales bacterium]